MVSSPAQRQGVPGASFFMAPKVSERERRPMMDSA